MNLIYKHTKIPRLTQYINIISTINRCIQACHYRYFYFKNRINSLLCYHSVSNSIKYFILVNHALANPTISGVSA